MVIFNAKNICEEIGRSDAILNTLGEGVKGTVYKIK